MSKVLFSLFFVGALLPASTLDVSTACIIDGGPNPQSQYGTSCSVADGFGSSASASGGGGWTVSNSISGPASPYIPIDTQGPTSSTPFQALTAEIVASGSTGMYASPTGPGPFPGWPQATATSTLSISLGTTGPQRQGYLEILYPFIYNNESWDEVFSGTFSLSVRSVSASCTAQAFTPPTSCGPLNSFRPYLVPVEIGAGETYMLTISETAMSVTSPVDEHDSGVMLSSVSIQFLEADGSTPVPMHEAPEPTSWGLLAIGLAGGWAVTRRGYSRRVHSRICRKTGAVDRD